MWSSWISHRVCAHLISLEKHYCYSCYLQETPKCLTNTWTTLTFHHLSLQAWLWPLVMFSLSFHNASEFCKSSARSLVTHYLDGALPCSCDKAGSTSHTCEPIGGQCLCRRYVIGRQCSRCATGFYGFPYCRRERPLLDDLHTAHQTSLSFPISFIYTRFHPNKINYHSDIKSCLIANV